MNEYVSFQLSAPHKDAVSINRSIIVRIDLSNLINRSSGAALILSITYLCVVVKVLWRARFIAAILCGCRLLL